MVDSQRLAYTWALHPYKDACREPYLLSALTSSMNTLPRWISPRVWRSTRPRSNNHAKREETISLALIDLKLCEFKARDQAYTSIVPKQGKTAFFVSYSPVLRCRPILESNSIDSRVLRANPSLRFPLAESSSNCRQTTLNSYLFQVVSTRQSFPALIGNSAPSP